LNPAVVFAGNLLELLLASDRSYMLNNPDAAEASIQVSTLNAGALR